LWIDAWNTLLTSSTHHFIQEVSPSTAQKLITKIKAALQDADLDSENLDLDDLNTHLADFNGEDLDDRADNGHSDESEADNYGVIFDVADSVGKALALVKQVHHPHRQ
jgi:hypothetical protein